MIEGLKPHSAYKNSGVPWLGQVPEHWEILRSKRLFAARKEFAAPEDVQLSATQAYGVIPQSEFERRVGRRVVRISMHLEKRRHVEKDDFVISMRSFQGGLERAWAEGAIRSSYVVLKAQRGIDIGFFAHLFKSHCYIRALQSTSDFIRDGQDLNFSNFSSVDLPLPPIEEQAAMGRFLNHANRRIDRFIRAKRKLIALLNEQKQAVILRAVTRGLDPNAPMKDSGVPWLGEIPAHWSIRRIKNEFTCLNHRRVPLSSPERGKMTSRLYDYYGASGVIDRVDDYLFDDDLLLIAEDGANLVLRNLPLAIIARGKFWVNNHAHILKPISGNIEYLAGVLETISYRPWITGAAQPKLTKDRLLGIAIPVAPRVHQDLIVSYLAESTRPLRASIQQVEREISLIREYRTRLVADVVTGQLDVREAAARLPADEPEAPVEELASEADQEEDGDPEEMAE